MEVYATLKTYSVCLKTFQNYHKSPLLGQIILFTAFCSLVSQVQEEVIYSIKYMNLWHEVCDTASTADAATGGTQDDVEGRRQPEGVQVQGRIAVYLAGRIARPLGTVDPHVS